MSDLVRAEMPKGNHGVFPVLREDPHLPIGIPLVQNPPMKGFARGQLHEEPQSCNVHVSGWELQFFADLGDNIDQIDSGTVAASDLILLADVEPLRRDPIITTQCDRDLGFRPERAKAGSLITILDG